MIALARKHKRIFSILIAAIFVLLIGVAYEASQPPKISLNGNVFRAEIVDTEALREKGLSGRDSIGPKDSMVFVFDKQGNHCFWMKDMKFSIDIVWVDTSNKVTAMETFVSPTTYPKNFCHNGIRVIELPAGAADQTSIDVGNPVDL